MDISRYDTAEMLDDPSVVIEFLKLACASNDPAKISAAVGVVARSEGMSKIAKETGLTREGLYKSLSEDGNPSFATILNVLNACGFTLVPTKRTDQLALA